MAKRWQGGKGAGKGLKLMVLGPWWNVLRAGFETLSKCSISTLQNNSKKGDGNTGKELKLHGRVWGPGGTCFAQVLKPSKCSISTWQGKGKGRKRCTGGFRVLVKRAWRRCGNRLHAIFDLAKRWQGAKAARKGLGLWWNVLRAGFETL